MPTSFDLVIRQGTILDGTGRPGFQGDVAIQDGVIAEIGAVGGKGAEEIDAKGLAVTPGFVDIHTHYDGHVTWAERLNPSSQHGVTTILMGNCGVGFAPCKPTDRDKLVHLMEGVEDIPEVVMAAGLPWNWETFPDYLDRLAERQYDMDVAAQVPHAALRLYVMGDRAVTREPANAEEIAGMRALAKQAVEAGALGFSTSRSIFHKSTDGIVIPSQAAEGDELVGIAKGLGEAGKGVLQMISDFVDVDSEFAIIKRMVKESGRPLSMSVLSFAFWPGRWRQILDRIEASAAEGLPIRGQVSGRPVGLMLGFGVARNPFIYTKAYQEIADLAPPARLAALRDPARRARILSEFSTESGGDMLHSLLTNFANIYELKTWKDYEAGPTQSIAARAKAAGKSAAEFAYDILAADGDAILMSPTANFAEGDTSAVETMMASEHTIFGLGDGGAHCGLLCDASLTTYMLRRWSNAGSGSMPVEQVVKALTSETAAAIGLGDRGVVAKGRRADLNVIDFAKLDLQRPRMFWTLPQGGGIIGQETSGYVATLVAGQVTYRNGVATGALPGRLVRGARAAAH